MCRHLAYLGPPVSLHDLLLAPPHSLLRQSYAPRMQRHGVVNADGFGVGWYDHASRPEPVLYRRATPIWSDESFASLAGVVRSGAVVASVRSATPPSSVDERSTPPMGDGPWLFALNGSAPGFGELRRSLSDERRAGLATGTDTETLFALALDLLDAGRSPAEALAGVVAGAASPNARLNMLLSDGAQAAATAWGDTLFVRTGEGVTIASEPFDDAPDWEPVPDRSVVVATAESIKVEGLA
jgi:glutamine amidotransferase